MVPRRLLGGGRGGIFALGELEKLEASWNLKASWKLRKEAETMKKFWLVSCERGHRGTGKASEIKFAIEAPDLISALTIARKMPSVKHTRMPFLGREITEEDYISYRQKSAYERFESHKRKRK